MTEKAIATSTKKPNFLSILVSSCARCFYYALRHKKVKPLP